MWWQIRNLSKRLEKEKLLKLCKRCGILHSKRLTECPHCSSLDDENLSRLLLQRAESRMSMGNTMLYFVAVFVLIILVVNIF